MKGKVIKEIVDSVGNAADKNFTTKEERLEKVNEDRSDARDMQENSQNKGYRFSAADYIAFFMVFVASLYIFMATFMTIPESNQRIADTITGFLMGTIIAAIINFYFGSSDGSKTKTSQFNGMIERIINKRK